MRQLVATALVLLISGAGVGLAVRGSWCRGVEAGFWFEDLAYDSERLGGPIAAEELADIRTMARDEILRAFRGLNITFTDRRDARHRVRVVQELRDMRFRRAVLIPAESRAVAGVGGQGAVNFSWLASSAVIFAPQDADRGSILAGIARGIGRAAVHEFTHLLLPTAPIHDSENIRSFEYRSAARREQYYGDMHWDLAGPLLEKRLAHCETHP
jgi:hypothetical protein